MARTESKVLVVDGRKRWRHVVPHAADHADGLQVSAQENETGQEILDDVRLGELLGEYDAAIAELEGLGKLETSYAETVRETSEGGKIMSLTEYHERQGLVEEVRETSEESLSRLRKRTRELREQRNRAYKAIVEGLPEGRWIRNGSEAVRVESGENGPELVRVLAAAVAGAPVDASLRRIVRISRDLEGGPGRRLAARLAPAMPAAGSVVCWTTAAAIVIGVSPDSPMALLFMLPMLLLAFGGLMFGAMFLQQISGRLSEE